MNTIILTGKYAKLDDWGQSWLCGGCGCKLVYRDGIYKCILCGAKYDRMEGGALKLIEAPWGESCQ